MNTNFTKTVITFLFLVVLMLAAGCKKPIELKNPMVTILEHSVEVGHNMALLYAEVTDDGGAAITERGFCYGKEGGSIDTLMCDVDSESFSVKLTNLLPLTTYTCQAFAGNKSVRGYSSEFRFTTVSDTVPSVKTWYVREVTYCYAVASGQVLGSGGQEVMERGICYSVEPGPTVADSCVAASSGVGPFDCQLTGLMPETVYYVRAYAVCSKGVYYGSQIDFVTESLPLEVRTGGVSDITASRVRGEGKVVRDGGCEVTECGFCWGTEHQPTIEGLHFKAGIGVGSFSCYFSGLEKGITHYMRAYAINEKGVAYGEEVEFLPDDSFMPWSNGVSPGLFSVGENRQVRFSQGNLQYYPDDNKWRFAEHQWDFVGGPCWGEGFGDMNVGTVYVDGIKCDNTKVFRYYPGWIDLFGWGTSGWNTGNKYYRPYDFIGFQYENGFYGGSLYGPPGNYDLAGDYAQADWGVHNTITNGGSRQWRTPATDEFLYLLTERHTPSGIRFAMAAVAGVRGLVVLPDDWNESIYYLRMANVICYYTTNVITAGEWLEVLEPAGAVFLPAGGERYQYAGYEGIYFDWFDNEYDTWPFTSFYISGSYWTASQGIGVDNAFALKILGYDIDPYYEAGFIGCKSRYRGYSVRLISDE